MWQGKSCEVVEGAGTAIYNQDVKNISDTSLWLKTLYLSTRWLKHSILRHLWRWLKNNNLRAWRMWSWVCSGWENTKRNVEPWSCPLSIVLVMIRTLALITDMINFFIPVLALVLVLSRLWSLPWLWWDRQLWGPHFAPSYCQPGLLSAQSHIYIIFFYQGTARIYIETQWTFT